METQTTATPATPPTPEQVLEGVWQAAFSSLGPVSRAFVLDQGLVSHVAEQVEQAPEIGSLGLTPEQVYAALECWRSEMIAAVDELADYYIAAAKNSLRR